MMFPSGPILAQPLQAVTITDVRLDVTNELLRISSAGADTSFCGQRRRRRGRSRWLSRVHGPFHRTLGALKEARSLGLETQVNTTVTRRNLGQLVRIAGLVAENGAKLWSFFFLVVTGRALLSDDLQAEEYESVFARLHAISLNAPFGYQDDRSAALSQVHRPVAAARTAHHTC